MNIVLPFVVVTLYIVNSIPFLVVTLLLVVVRNLANNPFENIFFSFQFLFHC